MNTIYLTIACLALAAVLGLIILIKWLTKKEAPRGVVYSHGLVAAVGLISLIVYAVKNPANFPMASIVLLVVSALGGFYMFIRDMNKKESPLAIAFVHALLAVSGFIALLVFALS